jgi:glycosyltransferase involved in cell wall biosynthesis
MPWRCWRPYTGWVPAPSPNTSDSFDVSVVLPAFNEVGHVEEELDRIISTMEASEYSFEIIVVDDGSTDGTLDLLENRDDIRLIVFDHNRGPGSARKIGTEAAAGSVVVWTDVDMSYPNEEIPRLVAELEGYDQVVGARTAEEGTHKFARVPAKWAIRRLAEFLSRTSIPDLNSGFRAFRRDVADQFLYLLPDGFSHVTTLTMAFLSNGYSIKYIDIDYSKRAGQSKFHWWVDSKRYLLQVTRMVMMWSPMRVVGPWAFALLAIGFGKLIFDLFDKNFRVGTNTLLTLFAGGTLLAVALLADLVVQVTRPRTTVNPAAIRFSKRS